MESIIKVFADVGGIAGILLVVICWMVYSNTQITKTLLEITMRKDERLMDLKKSLYNAGRLPERRDNRYRNEPEIKNRRDDDSN